MANQANILSFDEVKRATRTSRPNHLNSAPRSASRNRSASSVRINREPRIARISYDDVSARASLPVRDPRQVAAPTRQPFAARGGSAARMAPGVPMDVSQVEEAPQPQKKASRFATFKRERAKNKADRAFTRQFGGSNAASSSASSSAAASEGAPRAAVYKTQMGTQHRRATRLQGSTPTQAASQKRSASSVFASLKSSPKFIASAAVTLCLVLSCAFLYPSAQQYYQALREHDQLAAEYTAVEQRNSSISSEVDFLKTDAGVQDYARDQLGLVPANTQTATVRGLDLEDEASTFQANIVPGSVKAPDTWYSPFLDAFFGVE